MVEVTVSHYC